MREAPTIYVEVITTPICEGALFGIEEALSREERAGLLHACSIGGIDTPFLNHNEHWLEYTGAR